MKTLKADQRKIKIIRWGSGPCYEYFPVGSFGFGQPRSCEDYCLLPECCKAMVLADVACFTNR